MSVKGTFTLSKEERICSKKLMEQLFNGGTARSMSSFPLRVVFTTVERQPGQPPASIIVSVPKRHFKHAVDRNRVKRQLREAYRHHKQLLAEAVADTPQKAIALSLIWMDGRHLPSSEIDHKLQNLLTRIASQLSATPASSSSASADGSTPASTDGSTTSRSRTVFILKYPFPSHISPNRYWPLLTGSTIATSIRQDDVPTPV
jgi:ribonuclease P protein component